MDCECNGRQCPRSCISYCMKCSHQAGYHFKAGQPKTSVPGASKVPWQCTPVPVSNVALLQLAVAGEGHHELRRPCSTATRVGITLCFPLLPDLLRRVPSDHGSPLYTMYASREGRCKGRAGGWAAGLTQGECVPAVHLPGVPRLAVGVHQLPHLQQLRCVWHTWRV